MKITAISITATSEIMITIGRVSSGTVCEAMWIHNIHVYVKSVLYSTYTYMLTKWNLEDAHAPSWEKPVHAQKKLSRGKIALIGKKTNTTVQYDKERAPLTTSNTH